MPEHYHFLICRCHKYVFQCKKPMGIQSNSWMIQKIFPSVVLSCADIVVNPFAVETNDPIQYLNSPDNDVLENDLDNSQDISLNSDLQIRRRHLVSWTWNHRVLIDRSTWQCKKYKGKIYQAASTTSHITKHLRKLLSIMKA